MAKRVRRGIAAIVFFRKNKEKKYLLLRRKKNWKGWEWVKGGRKKGESELKCLKRELKEEVGTMKFKVMKTKFWHFFEYERPFIKDHYKYSGSKNRIYVVEVFSPVVKIDKREHYSYGWLEKKQALKLIKWPDQRRLFKRIAT